MRQPAKVQSVIVPKDRFTKRQAQSWVAKHGFIDPGVDETDDYYRFRQMDPDRQHFKYRTIPFGESGIQAVVQVSRLPQMRSNPDDFDAVVDAIRAAPNDLKAIQLAYPMSFQLAHHLGVPVSTARGAKAAMETAQAVAQAVRSGVGGAGTSVAAKVAAMPEVAQALAGTGLVPVALAQATQIAEVQTSRGVVDVPVVEASSREQAVEETYDAPAVDTSQFYYDGGRGFSLVTAYVAFGKAEGLLEDYLRSLPESEFKAIVKGDRSTRNMKGSKNELIAALLMSAEKQLTRGDVFINMDLDRPSADEAVQAVDEAMNIVSTAHLDLEGTTRLRKELQQLLTNLLKKDLDKVAQHYAIDLRRTVEDQRAKRVVDSTVGAMLRNRAVRGDYEQSSTASSARSIYSVLPSFDAFIQNRIDYWTRRHPDTVLTLEKVKEYHDSKPDTVKNTVSRYEHDVSDSTVAAAVYGAAQAFRVIAQWYGANTAGFGYFEDRAADIEAKAMKMFRAEYAQKYGVSPPDAPTRRSNPGFDDFDAVVDAIRAAPNELKAMQLAYPMAFQIAHHLGVPVSTARGAKAAMETAQAVAQAVRSGVVAAKVAAMPEVAQALAGTGLVPVALAQATQIAEVQTSRGVVEVPVTDASVLAPDQRTTAPSVARERFSLSALFPFDATVEVIDRAKRTAQTATRHDQTTGLKERVRQVLARLPVSDLNKIAAHYNVDLRRTPADQRVQKIIEGTVGYILGNRAIRGDYEEDEEARVRERDEQQQWMIAQYRERHGLPPALASGGVEGAERMVDAYRERHGLPPLRASGVEGIEGAKRAGVEILSTEPPARRGGSPKIFTVRVPPGSYWIGDPCHSIPPKQFDDLVGGGDVVGTVDGYPVVAFSLENGDMGDYRDNDGYDYPIDSGMLGLVDARIKIDEQDASIREKVMRRIYFDKPTHCNFQVDGRWMFGNVVIKDRNAEKVEKEEWEEEEEEGFDDDDWDDDDTFDDKD